MPSGVLIEILSGSENPVVHVLDVIVVEVVKPSRDTMSMIFGGVGTIEHVVVDGTGCILWVVWRRR